MKRLLFIILLMTSVAANCWAVTDGVSYERVNDYGIKNVWIQDRAHTSGVWEAKPYCNTNARTAVLHDGYIYIAHSNANTITQGSDTQQQSVIYKVDATNGALVKELALTLNGEIYGGAPLSCNTVGVDNFGHLYMAPLSSNLSSVQPVYLVDKETGEMTLVGQFDKGDVLQRCDYIDVIGDLTREQAECNIMTVGANSEYIYRWHADQGDDFEGGFDGDTYLAILDFYPETVTKWGNEPVVKMISDEDWYGGELFYIDGSFTAPIIYDITGTMVDNFENVYPVFWPIDMSANGVCEFTLEGRSFVVYADAGHVNICELGEGMTLGGMQRYWTVPDRLGNVYNDDTHVQSISVELGVDADGYEEVTLFIFNCYNGMAVYKIGQNIECDEIIFNTCDVNRDGMVNITDLNAVLNALQGYDYGYNCDVNGDGIVNYLDLALVYQAIMDEFALKATEDQCDFNEDGVVNEEDWTMLLNAYGSNDEQYDLNNDGYVDWEDLCMMAMLLADLEGGTPTPVISWTAEDGVLTVTATGNGTVKLYIDGIEVSNPYVENYDVTKGVSHTATATAQVDGLTISQTAEEDIYVEGIVPEVTDAPVITIENTENGTVVTMIAEEGGDIYYRLNKDFGDFSEWTQYTGELLFNASGYYNIQAYAIADGKTASDIVTCSFIVQALPKTDAPVITSETTDDAVIVTAAGNGEVKLYKNGIEVENPCTVARTDADQEYTFTATAKEEGKQISETAYLTIIVPAREESLEEGYKIEKMWSFDDLSFMTTGDVRQGFGMNGKFYINNKASQKVIVVDENGLANVEYPGGANCGITRDEAGNLVISNASFPNAWTASTSIKVVNPETKEVKEYVVPEECGISGRCDFIGFAKGNLMEDGVLYLTGAANSGISVMTITGGEVNIDECYIAACNGLSPSTSTVINYYTDLYGGEALLYVTRNANLLKIVSDGDGYTATTISLPGKGFCNGTFPFVWEGKEYFLYPYKTAGEANYLNGFAVAEAGAAAPLVEVPSTFTSNQNGYTCNWLNAEINNDRTVTVYQYYPGGNITVYKLSNGSTPAMEVTPMPEISYELTDDAVIVTATGNGVVKLYKGGVEVENPCIVPRTYVNQSIQFYATAQEEGKLISEGKTAKVTVPALPFYIVGNAPFGDWDPGAGVEMTSNGDVTYSYEATLDGDVWFVFANGLDPDWDVFNSNYRLAPMGPSDLYVYEGEWNSVYRVNNSAAFQFTGVGAKYTITLDPANMRFKIEFKDWVLKTDPPVITSETTDDAVIVTATGNGEVKLYKEGIEVENPCIIPRTYTSQDIEFYATAQEEGKLVSDKNYVWIYVPAKQYAINEADLAILTEFYNQYGNSSFTWSLALDDFYCEGVTVENERVVAIELPSISLVGAFPTMLLGLSQLHTLDLSYNNLSGDVASDIQDYVATHGLQAANLQHLYVNNNKFEGNVGALAAQFSSLATLCARTNYFNDVNPMVDPQVSLDLSDQLLQVDADITSGLESMRESLPAICRYDHENQRFSSDINVYLTAEQQGCPWQLYVYNNNQSVVETYGNTYYGGNGQIVSGQTWLYGSWSNEQRLQAKFTFAAGDANMNGPVDITDLQAMVLYIFGEYNKPFNYTAANLNNDNTVNVQDVVGEANLLLSSNLAVMSSGGRRMPATNDATQASLYWENGVLYLYSTVPVAAIDIVNDVDGDIKWNLGNRGMVVVNATSAEGEHSVIYSLSDAVIPAGVTAIATTTGKHAAVVGAMLSDTDAELISVKFNDSMTGLAEINGNGRVTCNMAGSNLVINSDAALHDVDVTIYSIDGRIVASRQLSHLECGSTTIDMSDSVKGHRYYIIVVRSGRQILATQKLTQNK